MGALEGILIFFGIIAIMASFFIPEKLSKKEVDEIAKLSEAELKVIVEKNLKNAENSIEESIDDALSRISDIAERHMEKESNEKIMHISEYSDGVLSSIEKTHNEVVFLYSMLNDKYTEMTDFANQLTSLRQEMEEEEYSLQAEKHAIRDAMEALEKKEESLKNVEIPLAIDEKFNETEMAIDETKRNILDGLSEGLSEVEIARKYGVGIGVVRLVSELYKGE